MKNSNLRLKVLDQKRVVKIIGNRKRYFIQVACICGVKKYINESDYRNGKIKSCGCLKKDLSIQRLIDFNNQAKKYQRGGYIHGDYGTKFINTYKSIKNRCNNKNYKRFHLWGGRGIACDWSSYKEFKDDMYESYRIHIGKHGEKNTSIDRINNNGNYSKENCRWATPKEQANNTSRNNLIKYNGQVNSLSTWADILGIKRSTLSGRIHKQGKSFKEAIKKPN